MRGSQEFLEELYNTKYRKYPVDGIYLDKDKTTGKVVWSRSGRFPFIHSTNWRNGDNQSMQYNNGVYISIAYGNNNNLLENDKNKFIIVKVEALSADLLNMFEESELVILK